MKFLHYYRKVYMLTSDDLEAIGEVVNKRFETFEVKIEGNINAAIQASEERLRSEIVAARTEAKADNLRILGKLDKQNSRIEN